MSQCWEWWWLSSFSAGPQYSSSRFCNHTASLEPKYLEASSTQKLASVSWHILTGQQCCKVFNWSLVNLVYCSCINPLIYGFMSRNFRQSFTDALCQCKMGQNDNNGLHSKTDKRYWNNVLYCFFILMYGFHLPSLKLRVYSKFNYSKLINNIKYILLFQCMDLISHTLKLKMYSNYAKLLLLLLMHDFLKQTNNHQSHVQIMLS